MSRRFLPALWAFTLLFLLMQAPVMAASYVVAPFKVSGAQGYSYLGQAVPSMLTSRLFLQGQFEPSARQDAALKEKAPAGKDAAASLAKKYGADYVVWGNITVMGDQASLDVSALSPSGKLWTKASTSPVNALIAGLQNVADCINIEVFGRKDVAPAAASSRGAASPNSAFVANETSGSVSTEGTYLNPSLRYQGATDEVAQLRSQMMKYECYGSEIADIDGDGKNEVLMLTDKMLYAYKWKGANRLEQIAEHLLPSAMSPVLVRYFKDSERKGYIIVSGHDQNQRDASSLVLQFSNGKFQTVVKNIDRYLNVMAVPPLYNKILIGQDADRSSTVSGRIYEVQIMGNKVVRRGNIDNMPKGATLFNCVWLPADSAKTGDHSVMVTDLETLALSDIKGQRLASTEDAYCSTSVYIVGDRGIGNLSTDPDDKVFYYVPMRMLTADLDRDGRHELIVSKPVTSAGKLFSNYRTYPQGEVHALLWDGMGLDLLWKTRRIKGTICDINLADANNDGTLDLVVTVNAYGGLSNGLKTRSAVYLYPLNSALTNAKPNFSE